MKYPTLSRTDCRTLLHQHRADNQWDASPFVDLVGSGAPLDLAAVSRLVKALAELRVSFNAAALPTAQGRKFEAQACTIVHRELRIEVGVASNSSFWRWVTFGAGDGELCRLVDWRFGTQSSIADVNYGISSKASMWEGLFARLWWRGHLGYSEESDDRYSVARRGDMDIWRSHILRQEFGRCGNVARALVCYQYPATHTGRRGRLRVQHLRELAKRLRILHASMAFELLSYEGAFQMVERQAQRVMAQET